MEISRIFKLITAVFEALLGFPILGGLFVFFNGWTPLLFMLVLHTITLVLTRMDKGTGAASVLGIITSLIAWIPGVGMVMHWITSLALFISALRPSRA